MGFEVAINICAMPNTGTLLQNRYLIVHIERISSFSKIFFALDTYQDPPRSCLVKIFEPIVQKIKIANRIEQEFQQEVKYLKQLSLSNSHIPEIYTYSNELQSYYIVRELVRGEPLNKKIESKGTLSCKTVRKIIADLLLVLSYLHHNGVIHQNIKPKNIILRKEDLMPMLINFGSIKQIVNTYGFYGDKRIFSSNNVHGYAPPEQALGKSIPASDLYSLGLTALYLLTGKHPIDLAIASNADEIQVPSQIYDRDPQLATIIQRAINSKIGDRYADASAMHDDLFSTDAKPVSDRVAENPPSAIAFQEKRQDNKGKNWWQLAIYALSGIYILGAAMFAFYDWNLDRNLARSLPEPLPESAPEPLPEELTEFVPPLMLNSPPSDRIEIPIFTTGTSKEELRQALGKPNAIQKGYWGNSSAWIYNKQASDSIDLGYLFDSDTSRLRQTEVAISPDVGLATTKDILISLLEGNVNPEIESGLQNIYNRQTNEYTFKLGNLEGSIEREPDDHIYLGVWEADFH